MRTESRMHAWLTADACHGCRFLPVQSVAALSKDLNTRIADSVKATTAAVVAGMGPAIKAALSEALPHALSAGAGAAALERATTAAVRAQLPRAVADGLSSAFMAQVVPPLERGTQAMFVQVEAALKAGLTEHLAPLTGVQAQLKDALRDANTAAAQLQQAASKASAEATAAAAAARSAAASAASVPPPAPAAPAASVSASVPSASTSKAAPSGKASKAAPPAPASSAVSVAMPPLAPATSSTASSTPPPAKPPVPAAASAGGAAPEAGAVTSEPVPGPIQALIASGQHNEAFTKALEANQPALVVAVCRATPADLLSNSRLGAPCPLTQPCLLSLLTFLAFDVATIDTAVKLRWIEAIAPCVDSSDVNISGHVK